MWQKTITTIGHTSLSVGFHIKYVFCILIDNICEARVVTVNYIPKWTIIMRLWTVYIKKICNCKSILYNETKWKEGC